MIGGCLALAATLVALLGLFVVFWQEPISLLILIIPFFLFRSSWRKHMKWMEKAVAHQIQIQDEDDYAEALIDFHRGQTRPQGVVRDLSDMPEPGHSLRSTRMGIPSDELPF